MREQINHAFDEVQARLEGVKAELDDEARFDWFLNHYGHLGKNEPVGWWRGWAETREAEARENGYPKPPPPPLMRITRDHFGKLFEPLPREDPWV
ncbi:hypothetical protein [Streptomyces mirabilis]|uniref:hypothetical protein n=1 Tax=Streptomyces mirabilis TaxID=68239 RepID=UPI0036DA1845